MQRDDEMSATDSIIAQLLEYSSHPSELSQQYDAAKDLDELLLIGAERVFIAALSIFFSFKIPKRGVLILRILKHLNRRSYDHHFNLTNRLFSECDVYVARLVVDCARHENYRGSLVGLMRRLVTWSGSKYYITTRMTKDEIKNFKEIHLSILFEIEDHPIVDPNDHFQRIFGALGRKLNRAEIATFVRAAIINTPLRLIEPTHFIRNLNRICPNLTDD